MALVVTAVGERVFSVFFLLGIASVAPLVCLYPLAERVSVTDATLLIVCCVSKWFFEITVDYWVEPFLAPTSLRLTIGDIIITCCRVVVVRTK